MASGGELGFEIGESIEGLVGDALASERPQVLGRLEFGTVGRQEDEAKTFGDPELGADVPPGAIEHEENELLGAGARRPREVREDLGKEIGVDRRADEPFDTADERAGARSRRDRATRTADG